MTEWRTSPSFPEYEVSDCGDVRTRFKSATRAAGRILKGSIKSGYRRYELWISASHQRRMIGAHALVCEAFHGPKPSESHVPAHWDGVRLNNTPANLRWATPLENNADRLRHGRTIRGSKSPFAKLDDNAVDFIRTSPRVRGSQKRLADHFGVSESVISNILNGHAWRDQSRSARSLALRIAPELRETDK